MVRVVVIAVEVVLVAAAAVIVMAVMAMLVSHALAQPPNYLND
jgi:hypothetical protein